MYLRGRSWVISQCHQSGIQRNARWSVSLFCMRAEIKWALCNEESCVFTKTICPIIGGPHLISTIFFGDGWYFIIIQRFMLRFSPNYGTAFQMIPTGGGRCHERIVTTKSKGIFFPFHRSFWGQWRHDYFQTDYKEDNCLSLEKAALDYLQLCSKVIRHVH